MRFIKDDCSNKGIDYISEIQKQIEGKFVVTRYNNKTYKISNIDFTKSPLHKFIFNKNEITYKQYLKTRYDEQITDDS